MIENNYSFDHGPVHIAVVNSNYWVRSHLDRQDHPGGRGGQREGWLNDEILEWLDEDLADARRRGSTHLFVCTHEPGFPNGGHAHDAMYWNGEIPEVLTQRDRFFHIMARHRVAALLVGDEHNYSRTIVDDQLVEGLERPLWQLTSGGAGAPYYAQDLEVPWTDHVRAFDPRQHFLFVETTGGRSGRARVEVIDIQGALVDPVDLYSHN